MSARKILALLLLAAGVFILVQGGFSFAKDKDTAKIGPLEFSVAKKERVELPKWTGIVAIALGAGLLLLPGKR
jgi:drug/metabolite transporter (DMT)-like permease